MEILSAWAKNMGGSPRVLQLSSLPLARGGIETFLINLTASLSNHYDMVVASGGNQEFSTSIENVKATHIAWQADKLLDIPAYQGLLALVEQQRPALVHIHDARAGLLGRLALAGKHIPILMTTHLPSYYYRWKQFQLARRSFYATIESILNRLATTKVIYPSISGYQYALAHKIVPVSKAVCIPNGINLRQFKLSTDKSNAFRARLNVKQEQVVICTIGRLSVEKNVALIIQAFTIIHAKHPTACLWIIGDGPERTNLEGLVIANGLSEQTKFLGGNVDTSLALAASDVFVLASWYEGGRTLAVMEAQASGKPCVVSSVGDLPSMVEDGIHGYIFPEGQVLACANGLEKLLSSRSQRRQMGQAAFQKAQIEYDISSMASAYDQLYQSVLTGSTSG